MSQALDEVDDGLTGFDWSSLEVRREAAGYSVDALSKELRIGKQNILALEKGDLASLPSAVFVRGYIRQYAGVLKLDVDELLAAYESALALNEPKGKKARKVNRAKVATIDPKHHSQATPSKKKGGGLGFIFLVVVLVLAGLAGWLFVQPEKMPSWLSNILPEQVSSQTIQLVSPQLTDVITLDSKPAPEAKPEPESEPELVLEPVSTDPDDIVDVSAHDAQVETVSFSVDESESSGVVAEAAVAVVDTALSSPEEIIDEGGVNSTETSESTSISEEVAAIEQSIIRSSDVVTEPAEPVVESITSETLEVDLTELASNTSVVEAEASSNVPQSRLVIEFTDDCWVEVRDASGSLLVASIRGADRGVDVSSDALPLSVTLGALSSVAFVEFDGVLVALDDTGRGNVSRLTLGDIEN